MTAIAGTTGRQAVGRFSVEFEATNGEDVIRSGDGLIAPDKVRRLRLNGVVDTGATRLVLPESAVRALGLTIDGQVSVRFADGRSEPRDVALNVRVELLGRSGTFSAVVEPGRSDALVGAIVLEELDLVVDCTHSQLVPRDPRFIIAEIE
jgi:predicted aspartyl protease